MKILEITEFSAGICGVWTRVLAESREFVKLGHEVHVFSSDAIQGTDKKAAADEIIDGIRIRRFASTHNPLTKNVNNFDFKQVLIYLTPDIVITHLIHPHSFEALRICREQNTPCYLVTHAPFNVKRRFPLNLATKFYYNFKVKPAMNFFTRIIAITKWELPYLYALGVEHEKISYIPNGLPDEFFKQIPKENISVGKDVLFLGRISQVKNIKCLLEAAKCLPQVEFSVVGSQDEEYVKSLNIPDNVNVYPPIYDLKKKIELIDDHKIFVLPSIREAMPQALLEALSRGRLVISSDTDGGKELINDMENGFLFKIGDSEHLAALIKDNMRTEPHLDYMFQTFYENAVNSARPYAWKELIKSYLLLFENDKKN